MSDVKITCTSDKGFTFIQRENPDPSWFAGLAPSMTIHVRVKKMEDEGIIQGSTLTLNYEKMGYSFIAHVGVFLEKTSMTQSVIENLKKIPNVTVAYVTAGKYNIFCKVTAKGTNDAKDVIYRIDDIPGVNRTETMIALEESLNDKKRMMHAIFAEL